MAGLNAFAEFDTWTKVKVGTLYYHLDNNNGLAQVTYPESGNYTNKTIKIPSTITQCSITYNVTSIGDRAFDRCDGLTSVTIPNSVVSIGNYAFYACYGLTSITIPESVTSIGGSAFYECIGLNAVHINDLAAWCNISFSTYNATPLYYANHLYMNNQEIKDLIIPENVSVIRDYAFCGGYGLTSVTIPDGVVNIGRYAFWACAGVTSVTIPDGVVNIGHQAFSDCRALESVTIGNGVTDISEYAFHACWNLTSVTIDNNAIASKSYNSSSNLANIFGSQVTEYIFGDNVQSIGTYI